MSSQTPRPTEDPSTKPQPGQTNPDAPDTGDEDDEDAGKTDAAKERQREGQR